MKNKIIVLVILITALFLTGTPFKKKQEAVLINEIFPYELSSWHGEDIEPDEAVYGFLDKEEFLFRLYKNKETDKYISLAIVLTQRRDHIHDPNICYNGQGISMDEQLDKILDDSLNVKFINGQKNAKPYYITYWYTDFENSYVERAEFMKKITLSKFFNKSKYGFGIIVLTAMGEIKPEEITAFASEVNKALEKQVKGL